MFFYLYVQDVTPEGTREAIRGGFHARALLLSLHLNETPLIQEATEAVPRDAIPLVARAVPAAFLERLLAFLAEGLLPGPSATPHLEYYLVWCLSLLQVHGKVLRERSTHFGGCLKNLNKALVAQRDTLAKLYVSHGSLRCCYTAFVVFAAFATCCTLFAG